MTSQFGIITNADLRNHFSERSLKTEQKTHNVNEFIKDLIEEIKRAKSNEEFDPGSG